MRGEGMKHPQFIVVRIFVALILVATCLFGLSLTAYAQNYVNAMLPWHAPVLDSQQKLISWHETGDGSGFDHVVRIGWDFIENKVPADPARGVKSYLINSVFDPETKVGVYWQHNPASTFGQFVDSLVAWYPYSGDRKAIEVVREMLDYQLAHGTTPADWDWASVPFATSCGNELEYGRCVQGMPRDFFGGIETDKVGELGIGYVLFYELTGDKKYLDAAIRCADALAKHVQPGDADHTPWPFRVYAKTGDVLAGQIYGGMIVAPVRLFSELIKLQQGQVAEYTRARKLAWDWIMKYPMSNHKWVGYFEDIRPTTDMVNQASPSMTAYYILSAEDPASVDKEWALDAGNLIEWIKHRFGRGPFLGAWGIDEQGTPPDYRYCCSRAGLGSDASRWAAISAMYYEKTGDAQAREDAFRSLSYATYFSDSEGRVSCCGVQFDKAYWFDDGYGDYIRNFLWAMGAIPEFAPRGQDHLLRSSSVVTDVQYGKKSLVYKTFQSASSEVLRLSYLPKQIRVGDATLSVRNDLKSDGYTVTPLKDGDFVIRIRRSGAGEVRISG
jgi:hypothetical protein